MGPHFVILNLDCKDNVENSVSTLATQDSI